MAPPRHRDFGRQQLDLALRRRRDGAACGALTSGRAAASRPRHEDRRSVGCFVLLRESGCFLFCCARVGVCSAAREWVFYSAAREWVFYSAAREWVFVLLREELEPCTQNHSRSRGLARRTIHDRAALHTEPFTIARPCTQNHSRSLGLAHRTIHDRSALHAEPFTIARPCTQNHSRSRGLAHNTIPSRVTVVARPASSSFASTLSLLPCGVLRVVVASSRAPARRAAPRARARRERRGAAAALLSAVRPILAASPSRSLVRRLLLTTSL